MKTVKTAFGPIIVHPGETLDEAKRRSMHAWANGLDPLRRAKPTS